jgi:aerobic-type carbon monoxide dehydrogenase small subunit (CoxS/CutS family)
VSDACTITVDGAPQSAMRGHSLASALLALGVTAFRRDGDGRARAPVCGMGTCFECRVTVDGRPGVRACLETVREGMRVETAT